MEKLRTPLIQELDTDWVGPEYSKFSNEGGVKLSPSLFIIKSTLKRSFSPKDLREGSALKDTSCAESRVVNEKNNI